MPGVGTGELQIGAANSLKRGHGVWFATIKGGFHLFRKNLKPLAGNLCDQILAAFEMAIGGCGTNASLARSFSQSKSGRSLLLDKRKSCLHKRLLEIAVVIAFTFALRFIHGLYITPAGKGNKVWSILLQAHKRWRATNLCVGGLHNIGVFTVIRQLR